MHTSDYKHRRPTAGSAPFFYRIGAKIEMESSSLTSLSAPMSSHVTSGTVANPSRFGDGCTNFKAALKSELVMYMSARLDVLNEWI